MTENASDKPLAGQIALVAGATRGAGRAIAIELGAAGATVYATGRSTRGNPSPMARAETIEETAELVDAAGGHANRRGCRSRRLRRGRSSAAACTPTSSRAGTPRRS